MFKKRPNIPPRPKPPVAEQVLDDLKNAPDDDIVFVLMKNSNDFSKSSVASTNIQEEPSAADDIDNPEVVYQKVKNFLEVNSNLQNIMKKLQEQNDILLSSDVEIKNMAEDIRRQAIEAVK